MATATSAGCYQVRDVYHRGQNYIGTISCGSSTMTPVSTIEYSAAGATPPIVNSNKSIVDVGTNGIIEGRGLRIYGASNVIIQNIHIPRSYACLMRGRAGDSSMIHGCQFGPP
ncbi:hypothetical protein TCE0_044r16137 [Talaromyces pinophilus]|uniref:Pectin lyase n=1 Tax=Talaromyces pinophilus TaxID=128442 RepID=A0A478ECM2_TALPI|nr:hypothetical protein TCE0_044r16137 [Talaromyces pinophilus]